jgi:hypothetical protein
MTVRARTTFMPEVAIEMEQGEYDSLLHQGLIVLDGPAAAGGETPTPPVAEAPPGSRHGRRASGSAPD